MVDFSGSGTIYFDLVVARWNYRSPLFSQSDSVPTASQFGYAFTAAANDAVFTASLLGTSAVGAFSPGVLVPGNDIPIPNGALAASKILESVCLAR